LHFNFPKAFYRYVNGKLKKQSGFPNLKDITGKEICSDLQLVINCYIFLVNRLRFLSCLLYDEQQQIWLLTVYATCNILIDVVWIMATKMYISCQKHVLFLYVLIVGAEPQVLSTTLCSHFSFELFMW